MFVSYRAPARMAGLFVALVFGLLSAAAIAQPETVEFDIPAQSLDEALIEFGQQSRQELFYDEDDVVGLTSNPVVGEMTRNAAMRALLRDTGLEFEQTASGGMMIGTRATLDAQRPTSSVAGQNTVGQRRPGIEEIIVTGQKKEERIQDVPIAITAFTQEDLTTQQIAGGPDLITQVPNMTFTKTNFSGYSIQLRGIGTQAISATTDPAVAVALNQTPFIRNRFFEQEFYDMERVEVLRGPQGTLFGRNATAGVVNLITAKPTFQDEARLSIDKGNYDSRRLEGMVNIPLVDDKVALRLAGAWTKRDGYATNELTDNPIDGRDLWSTRATLRITPNDRLNVNLIWEHFEENDDRLRSGKQLCKTDEVTEVAGYEVEHFDHLQNNGFENLLSGVQATFSQGCERNSLYAADSYQTPNGLMLPYYVPLGSIGLPTALVDPYSSRTQSRDLRTIESTVDPEYRARSDIGQLQISYQLSDGLTLDSETAYSTDEVYSLQDFNRFNTAPGAWDVTVDGGNLVDRGVLSEDGFFCDPQIGCANRLVAVDISTAESEQFSQEFRLSSQFEGPFNFSLGANYLRYDTEDKYYVFVNSLSLIAASRGFEGQYVGGETDNIDCQLNGYQLGDPNEASPVAQCVYIDPNPIGEVNDQGHNYFLSRNPYDLRSYAVFGEAYWNITDSLKLTAGLRWSVDKKTAPRIPSWILVSNSIGYPVAEVIEQTWREPTGRLVLDWKPNLGFTDETLIYGSVARGYKAGGANPPDFARTFFGSLDVVTLNSIQESLTRPKTFDAEFVNAFEIGTKNTLLDGDLTLNIAAFYYDYSDYQISEIVDRQAFNRNFDAESWGGEIETDWWALENLRLSFKAGYTKTRIADGEKAVDLMDRTAGNEDWTLVRPFPTFPSSCILPTFLFDGTAEDKLVGIGGVGGGNPGGCELAYLAGLDPVTQLPYEPDPDCGTCGTLQYYEDGTYPGFDPATAPNNGEGIAKDLGGNELPNAPNYTATISGDYIVPLSMDWSMTLHTDLHWQSKAWWRVFNDHEYSRLDDYFTMNLAAIFENSDGWHIMAYVKNVTNETAITGAFLNSDDTGLTTNVFLTEPRLFGLRVTKDWSGGGNTIFGGLIGGSRDSGGPYPLTVELGADVLRIDAPNENLRPDSLGAFEQQFPAGGNAIKHTQNRDLDWGDGRRIGLSYRPNEGPWVFSAGLRRVRVSGESNAYVDRETEPVCLFGGPFAFACDLELDNPIFEGNPTFAGLLSATQTDYATVSVRDREKGLLFDLAVGHDMPFGGLSRSIIHAGLRYAEFESSTSAQFAGTPDWVLIPEPTGNIFTGIAGFHTLYESEIEARRQFEGLGPIVSWEAAYPLWGGGATGRIDLDWSVTGGVLFGEQETSVATAERASSYETSALSVANEGFTNPPVSVEEQSLDYERDDGSTYHPETVPMLGASFGLSYTIDRFEIGAGYRWERYYSVLDGGFEEKQSVDRTMDGAYLDISVGFGG